MTVRKILNTIEHAGWTLVSSHSYTETGSEYIFAQNKELPPSAYVPSLCGLRTAPFHYARVYFPRLSHTRRHSTRASATFDNKALGSGFCSFGYVATA